MIQSPLNYTGGKYKLLPQILPYFPEGINTFVDLFCGGCNVGINVAAKKHVYSDNCKPLIDLYSLMKSVSADQFVSEVSRIISEYHLSDVKSFGYERYGCSSSDGLSAYNREPYLRLRTAFNQRAGHDDEYYFMLYVLITFAFNNQIRFNKNGEFNLPPGKRDFNQKMHDKLIAFMEALQKQNNQFLNIDFTDFNLDSLTSEDFVYADPPYLITCASYNEQDGWNEEKERALLSLLDELTARNIRFALSNVLESKSKTNEILQNWIETRPGYKLIDLDYTYSNANYQRRDRNVKSREILIINY